MTGATSNSVGLWRAAKLYWRYFIAIWLFPIALLCTLFLPAFRKYPFAYFFLLIAPAFFFATWVSSIPARRKYVRVRDYVVWAILTPFGIWTALIFGIFGLAFLAGAIDAK